jgi:hypothetical protein
MRSGSVRFALVLILVFGITIPATAVEWFIDLETGAVFPGYNDVRVPNTTGTPISLTADLAAESREYFRVRGGVTWQQRHTLSVLFAPLTIHANGVIDRPVIFEGVEFPAATPLAARYTFNSYRLTYRYRVYQQNRLTAALGVTAKIRDAAIHLQGETRQSETTNVGFVPLLSFQFQVRLAAPVRLIVDGDALAAPQGRAEDVALLLEYDAWRALTIKTGYRVLEGGADVETVYNFALLHYLFIGAAWEF